MKVQILSDLHLEFHKDRGDSFLEDLDSTGVDILIVAGDLAPLRLALMQLPKLIEKYKMTLLVMGNHEAYHTSIEEVERKLIQLEEDNLEKFRFMHRKIFLAGGKRILGAPLWYPVLEDNYKYASRSNDFGYIQNIHTGAQQQYELDQIFLEENLQQGDIVVTHFMPSSKSISRQYAGSAINRYFLVPMEKEIRERKPLVWIHGHTHHSFDYQLEQTRVIANPLGYPWEDYGYREKLVLTL